MATLEPGTVFFPLRSNTCRFDNTDYLYDFICQLKQSCILFENMVFEDGIFRMDQHEDGVVTVYEPSGNEGVSVLCKGKNRVEFASESEDGQEAVPPTGDRLDEWTMSYDEILDKIGILNESWVDMVLAPLKDEELQYVDGSALSQIFQSQSLQGDMVSQFRVRNIFHDMHLSDRFGGVVPMDSVHLSLLDNLPGHYKDQEVYRSGYETLSVMLPDISELSWDEVVSFRESRNISELRQKIVEIQQDAWESSAMDPTQLAIESAQSVTNAVFKEMEKRRPSILKKGLMNAVGLIPYLGPMATMIGDVLDISQDRGSWYSLVLRMRDVTK